MLAVRDAEADGLLAAAALGHEVRRGEARAPRGAVEQLRRRQAGRLQAGADGPAAALGPVVPAAGAEADDAAKVVPVGGQVLGERLGADLHEHLHVHLRLARVAGQQGRELRVAELLADADLGRRGEDLGLERQRDRLADALLADAVGAADDQEPVPIALLEGREGVRGSVFVRRRLAAASRCCRLGLLLLPHEELAHVVRSARFALPDERLPPALVSVPQPVVQHDAHLGAGAYHVVLRGERVSRVQVGRVEVAHVDLLLLGAARDGVYYLRSQLGVLRVRGTRTEVPAVQDALCPAPDGLLEEEQGAARAVVRRDHGDERSCPGDRDPFFKLELHYVLPGRLELSFHQGTCDFAAVDGAMGPVRR